MFGKEINAGVAWLDQNIPDWLGRMDLGKLDIAAGFNCVLAQASNKQYADANRCFNLSTDRAVSLGFLHLGNQHNLLTSEWKSKIELLRSLRLAEIASDRDSRIKVAATPVPHTLLIHWDDDQEDIQGTFASRRDAETVLAKYMNWNNVEMTPIIFDDPARF